MNINNSVGVGVAEFVRNYLHISRQDDKVNFIMILEQFQFFLFHFFFIILGDFVNMKGYVKGVGNMFQIRMIGNDTSNITV